MIKTRRHGGFLVPCLIVYLIFFLIIPPMAAGDVIPFDKSPLSQEYIVVNDPLTISGTIPGLAEIRMWIFGPQYADAVTLPVHPDGSFGYNITAKEIEKMESGNYTVILQSPGENGKYDIALDERRREVVNTSRPSTDPDRVLFTLAQAKTMLDTDAPDALVRAIGNVAVDDRYAAYSFSIADPFIELDPVRDYYVGETITISGRTNIPVNDRIFIMAGRFPSPKVNPRDIARQGGQFNVIQGPAGLNTFSINFYSDVSNPGKYDISVDCVNRTCGMIISSFTLLEGPPPTTVPPTTEQVETTASPTDTATTVTIQPTTTPFPAILSVAALGAVGIGGLIRRKKEE